MIALVVGGVASGKSAWAQGLALRLAASLPWRADLPAPEEGGRPGRGAGLALAAEAGGEVLYVATMRDDGSAQARSRIERHRGLRAAGGFLLAEVPRGLEVAVAGGALGRPGGVALLEGAGTLLANELFPVGDPGARPGARDARRAASAVVRGTAALAGACRDLVVVSDDPFRGGPSGGGDAAEPAPETLLYLEALASVNRAIAGRSDLVVEVVFGLPHVVRAPGRPAPAGPAPAPCPRGSS